jgi:hypothetical protein
MKAIIFLVCRSRFVVPRVGNFLYAQDLAAETFPHQPFVYQGRALDMAEFNEAAARLLDTRNAHLGYEVSVRLIDAPKPAAAKPKNAPVAETAPLAVEDETLTDKGETAPVTPQTAKKRASKARATIETEID